MSHKKWLMTTLVTAAFCLAATAGLNALIDPFFHYHSPLPGLSYSFGNQNYVNPGIVRRFDYDTLITGTSMTENFRPSVFEEILDAEAVKTSYSGGKSANFRNLIDLALRSNPGLKTVYMGLDLNMLDDEDPALPREPHPTYLYDEKPLNDANYLLNKSVLILSTGTFLLDTAAGLPPATFDDYNYWNDDDAHMFGRLADEFERVRGSYGDRSDQWPREQLLAMAEEHLRLNIIPLVEAWPQTDFVFFFPPYSILYWHNKNTEDIVAVLEYAIETLIGYENVRLFLPMNNAAIITDPGYYKDAGHYSGAINDFLVQCFRDGTHLLTVENYQEELARLTELVNGHYTQ